MPAMARLRGSRHGDGTGAGANSSETVLHSFASPPRGAAPFPGVIGDSGGNLYVVYKLEMAGNETVLIQLRKFHAKSRPSAT